MRVIICGAGQVGYNIAAYLAREDNDITIIDTNARLIGQINNELDVNGIVGYASHPDVLAQAGADEADMIIAVTHADEVNMIACQVAHSLFNVPKKVARVREQAYLDPAWANLFSRVHMPIDVIISPEIEVSRTINQRLLTPGTTNVITFEGGRLYLTGVLCGENCPVLNTQLKQLPGLFPDLNIRIAIIYRHGKIVIPDDNAQIEVGDEVYFFIDSQHLRRALAVFGHEEQEARKIVIMGGGNIALYLVNLLQAQQKPVQITIIEKNENRARYLSEKLDNVLILQGDALEADVIREAHIKGDETLIAVTNDDETNILGSLLGKQAGCARAITLVNKPTYGSLMSHLGIDAVVSPRTSTVSRIMQNVRRGRIKALHNLLDGLVEVIEAEVSETVPIAHKPLHALDLPYGIVIGAVMRGEENLTLQPETVIRPGDRVMILSTQEQARKVEGMFTIQVDLF